jgi:hypothetical protein
METFGYTLVLPLRNYELNPTMLSSTVGQVFGNPVAEQTSAFRHFKTEFIFGNSQKSF